MTGQNEQLKNLENKIGDLYKLSERLSVKGLDYQYPAHVVSEIANYLVGEGIDLKIAEQTFRAIVEQKNLTDIVNEECESN